MITEIGRRSKNRVEIKGEFAVVSTTKEAFIVDTEDIDKIKNYTWWVTPNNYVYTKMNYVKGNGKIVYLSRFLMNVNESNVEIDHIDRNPLNNRKSNLRISDRVTNNANKGKIKNVFSSNYKGVKLNKDFWHSSFLIDCRYVDIGIFDTEIAAANAYNFYIKLYLGDFAYLNDCPTVENWYEYKHKYGKKSMYQGVTRRKSNNMWQVHVRENNKVKYIGQFEEELDAAKIYNIKALELKYDLPKLNIIDGEIYGLTAQVLNNYKYSLQ